MITGSSLSGGGGAYSWSDGEDLPAGGVDRQESGGQQLPVRAVAPADLHQLVDADLKETDMRSEHKQ